MTETLTLTILTFTFFVSTWLGFYLYTKDPNKKYMSLSGLGLLAYSIALLTEILQSFSPNLFASTISQFNEFFIYLPALLWSGSLLHLTPENFESKFNFNKIWKWILFPLSAAIVFLHTVGFLKNFHIAAIVSGILILLSLLVLLYSVNKTKSKSPLGLTILGTIMFGLSIGLFLPANWLPRQLVIIGMSLDMVILGIGIAIFDAFDEGHDFKQDMLTSFTSSLLMSLLFGGQVILAISLSTGLTFTMVFLLLASIATATITQTVIFPNRLSSNSIIIKQEQEELQKTARNLPRLNPNPDFTNMSDQEFFRLTRRAISHLGDLPRLATSPMTRLPLIEHRLNTKSLDDNTLTRANELKLLLRESIQRLKPQKNQPFGTTDEWRYYNALYFPYVIGIKPSRRRQPHSNLEPYVAQALEWFQVEVPERTLHNWQNAASHLIAQHIKEQQNSL